MIIFLQESNCTTSHTGDMSAFVKLLVLHASYTVIRSIDPIPDVAIVVQQVFGAVHEHNSEINSMEAI